MFLCNAKTVEIDVQAHDYLVFHGTMRALNGREFIPKMVQIGRLDLPQIR